MRPLLPVALPPAPAGLPAHPAGTAVEIADEEFVPAKRGL